MILFLEKDTYYYHLLSTTIRIPPLLLLFEYYYPSDGPIDHCDVVHISSFALSGVFSHQKTGIDDLHVINQSQTGI